MSTTTQILFNSPALHSLKRDQLVKLCRIHSIKASGKNTDLIQRLKQHAETLPKDSPLSIAARSEEHALTTARARDYGIDDPGEAEQTMVQDEQGVFASGGNWRPAMPRPSEQWEIVMESIEELEECSSQGTLSSLRTLGSGNGEFGSNSSKATSVGSSIKALATSLGFRRHNGSKATLSSSESAFPSSSSKQNVMDELEKNSTPYSALPLNGAPPQTDHFTFEPPVKRLTELSSADDEAPLPGHSLRPGVPAPPNARLSLGLGLGAPTTPHKEQPTTTIRLISNMTTNDYDYALHGRTPQLKPFKTSFDLVLGSPIAHSTGFGGSSLWPPPDDTEGKRLYPALPHDPAPPSTASNLAKMHLARPSVDEEVPMPGTLVFEPSTSKATTSACLDVPKKPEPFLFGSPSPQHSVSGTEFKSAAASVLEEMNRRLEQEGVNVVGMDLIDKLKPGAHAQGVSLFKQPESKMTPTFTAKFDRLHEAEFKKMEGIDALAKRKARKSSGIGRDRYGRRIAVDSSGPRLSAKFTPSGRKPRIIPGSFEEDDEEEEASQNEAKSDPEDDEKRKKEEEQKLKEREATRRQLEINRAKRRSSMGVAGRGRLSMVQAKPQPKPSRFGFLSSAKSLVQNVWNRGKTTASAKTASNAPSGIPKPLAKADKLTQPLALAPKRVPSCNITRSSALEHASSSANHASSSANVPSLRVNKEDKTASARSRSPIPSFGATSSKSSVMGLSTKSSRTGSLHGTGASSKAAGGVSSIGTRVPVTHSKLSLSDVGSMGMKKELSKASHLSAAGSSSSRISSRSSTSRLLAPTASSLAKARPSVIASLSRNTAAQTAGAKADALETITNSSGIPAGALSPRQTGTFSRPIDGPTGIPSPVKRRPLDTSLFSPIPTSSSTAEKPANPTAALVPDAQNLSRQRSLVARKPRISRSKVIAKLASQRTSESAAVTNRIVTPSRKRSNLGTRSQRSSMSSTKSSIIGGPSTSAVVMSAKKRARQSEYVRRRSHIEAASLKMDVDAA